jgi:hypothetical protein
VTSFFLELTGAIPQYATMVFLSALFYWLAARPSAVSWFDPWAAQQVLSVFASAAVLFMWWVDIIDGATAIYHVAATAAFFVIAGWVFKARLAAPRVRLEVRPDQIGRLRLLVFLVFAVSQLLAWTLTGLPILLESRLDAFAAGDGTGFFSRLFTFSSTATLFLTVLNVGLSPTGRLRRSDIAVVAAIVLATVLNASKSAIIYSVLFVLSSDLLCSRVFPAQYRPIRFPRRAVALSLVAVVGLMLVPAAFEARRRVDDPAGGMLGQLLARVVLSGDGYMWFYGDGYLDTTTDPAPVKLLFSDPLGMSRLVPWDALPVHPGLAVGREVVPDSDSVRGPNVRLDVFGLLFGSMAAGVAFACVSGALFGALRAAAFRARTVPSLVTGVFLFLNLHSLLIDPVLGVATLVNAGIGFLLVWVLWRRVTAPANQPAADPGLASP